MKDKMTIDVRIYPLFFVLFVFETVSGIYLYVIDFLTLYKQFTILAHIILGLIILLPSLAHQILHTIRSVSSTKNVMKNLGYLGFVSVLASLVTGVIWGYQGTRADNYIITQVHLISSLAAFVIILIHIGIFIASRRKWALLNILMPRSNLIFGVVMVAVIMALSYTYKPVVYNNVMPAGYKFKWNDNPFYPSESMTSTGGFIDSKIMGNSKSCGD